MSDLSRRVKDLSSDKLELLLLQASKKRQAATRSAILPRPRTSSTFPLSFAQQRLWFLDQLVPGTAAYNIPEAVQLTGTLDLASLERSINAIMRRHESLRTCFPTTDGQPVQQILPPAPLPLPVLDLRALPDPARAAAVQHLLGAEAQRPFALASGPLVRATLLRLDAAEHLLLVTMHHIISDSWSLGVFVRELAALYPAYLRGQPTPLPPLPIQYADYTLWQREWLQDTVLEAQLAYWKQTLGAAPQALELPTDHPRPPLQTFRGAAESFTLPGSLATRLNALSQRAGVTLFMTLLAAFQALLARYTGQEEILVGSPIANRTRVEAEGLIGFFANTLVLRTDLSGNPPFLDLLRRVKEVCLGAYAHQDLPFEQLVEELHPERDLSRNPLFQVMFVLQNTPAGALELPDLTLRRVPPAHGTAKFDWWLSIAEGTDGLLGVVEYNTDLFEASTIRRMLGHLRTLLDGVVARPDQPLWALPLLTAAERQLLGTWNATGIDYPQDACLHELVAAQVARTPDTIAVVFDEPGVRGQGSGVRGQGTRDWGLGTGDWGLGASQSLIPNTQHLTYAELNRRANQLARWLQTLGVGPDVSVGLCMERSLELVIGMLGVLKGGGAYVPLDPDYPPDRLAFMLHDAQMPVLLTQSDLLARLPNLDHRPPTTDHRPPTTDHRPPTNDESPSSSFIVHRSSFGGSPIQNPKSKIQNPIVVSLDDDWETIAHAGKDAPSGVSMLDHVAYIVYTSGSTGTPKGVMVSHRAIANRLRWMQDSYGLGADDHVLQKTSYSFDVSVWEFFWPLMTGARLVLARPNGHKDLAYLMRVIAEQAITTLHFVPSVLQLFLDAPDLAACRALRRVICSGEALPVEVLERFFARLDVPLYNLYGPTEAAVDVTAWSCAPRTVTRNVPIGRPIANTQIHLLDRFLNPVPIGVPGELHIGGVQLARGYLNRPDLTAERFIPNPFGGVTGDRCWVTEDSAPNTHHPTPNTRLYRTGDLARYRADGAIEFLGRIDHQVKLRGLRIELGEIEATMRQHSAVHDAIALVREDAPDEKRLVAYILPQPASLGTPAQPQALLAAEQIGDWQRVFDTTYTQPAPSSTPTFNIAGWNSSYTDQPLPAEEMREWVDQTVARIRALRPRRVLEIGCGTGLLLLRLAPDCAHYCGTDFSPVAIQALQEEVQRQGLAQVTLLQRAADDFTDLADDTFDIVILNSVVQYFPDIPYLLRVLEGVKGVVAPGGRIFVGDVRSLPLLAAFHTAVEVSQAPAALPTARMRQRVRRRMQQEQELVIDPAFFAALPRRLPGLRPLAIQLKRGQYHNELTQFRYDVILQADGATPEPVLEWRDWQQEAFTLEMLHRLLQTEQPAVLGLARVPNARLTAPMRALELLRTADGPATVGELRAAIAAVDGGIDPEALWALGDAWGYAVTISWAARADGCCNVVFQRRLTSEAGAASVGLAGLLPEDDGRSWSAYANNPLQEKLAQQLVPALRSYLKEKLPNYMIPSAFVLLETLPLTPNGKQDRKALPAPLLATPEADDAFVAPRTPTEQVLAAIWEQVLGLERVGVHNNFFELGGDSIRSIQIVSRAGQAGLLITPTQMFQHPTIAELTMVAERISTPQDEPPLSAAPFRLAQLDQRALDRLLGAHPQIEDIYPLAPIQEHMLARYLAAPQPGLYYVHVIYSLPHLDVAAFERTWQQVIERHPALRSSFVWEGLDRPLQLVHTGVRVTIEHHDWRGAPAVEQEGRLRAYIHAAWRRGFDLTAAPHARLALFRINEQDYRFFWGYNYMLQDGWSFIVIVRDVFTLYDMICRGEEPHLPTPLPYREHIAWLQRQNQAQAEIFWRKMLKGFTTPTPLVSRIPGNTPTQEEMYVSQELYLPEAIPAALRSWSRQYQLTLNTWVQAAWALLLSRYTGEQDIVYGVVVSGRPAELAGVENMIGAFNNFLPMRIWVNPDALLLDWLREFQDRQVALRQYEYSSPLTIKTCSEVPGDTPLFESHLTFENFPLTVPQVQGWPARPDGSETQTEYPLRVTIWPVGSLLLILSYYRRAFDDATIARMLRHYQAILEHMAICPEQSVGKLIDSIDI